MNIFFNISHPAHVHLFKNSIKTLESKGHNITTGVRIKEFAVELLDDADIEYTLMTKKRNGAHGLLLELVLQQYKIAKLIRKHRFDLMVQMNGIFNAPIGKMCNIPTIALSDTEIDRIANRISFSLTRAVLSPTCFDAEMGGRFTSQLFYPGYHELAYLAPANLIKTPTYENRFLVRFVSWGAGHDIGEKGLGRTKKIELVKSLAKIGEVFVSSEGPLPEEISEYAFSLHPGEMHEFMLGCKLIVGESATMASEAACMGIPAVYISDIGRGYTTEQDQKYGLIKHFRSDQWDQVTTTLKKWAEDDNSDLWQEKRHKMLADKIDVTSFLVNFIEDFPESKKRLETMGDEYFAPFRFDN